MNDNVESLLEKAKNSTKELNYLLAKYNNLQNNITYIVDEINQKMIGLCLIGASKENVVGNALSVIAYHLFKPTIYVNENEIKEYLYKHYEVVMQCKDYISKIIVNL